MNNLKVTVITSCTGEKKSFPETQLKQEDFTHIHDIESFSAKETALNEYRTSAEEIYTGQQHLRLMKGINFYRENFGAENVDLWILSAGYGLIPAAREVVPYECTFQGMKPAEIKDWSAHLNIKEAARKVFAEPSDLTLVLLGDSYLKALDLDDSFEFAGPTVFLCSNGSQKLVKGKGEVKVIPLSNKEAKRFSCGLVALKGELASRILMRLISEGEDFKSTLFNSEDPLSLFDQPDDAKPGKKTRLAPQANAEVDKVISIPTSWWEKQHRSKLRYFIPEWDDLVDPDYDFETDTHSGGSGDWSNETYAHQMYPEPNYDGILISKVVAEKSVKKKERINRMGVHRFLRVPDNFPIMGDCGAFGYIMDEVPPYTTAEILEYYTRLGFNYGVSLDHLIVKATEDQKQFRYDLTINNAEEFLVEHRKLGLNWEPIGAVQGWSPETYADAARKYVAMGYKYIGLGGLVRTSTKEVLRMLEEVHKVVPQDVAIHLFGLARISHLKEFAEMGVRSVDSASLLRRAWMGTGQNYLAETGTLYGAIRIPENDKSFRAKRIVSEGRATEDQVKKMEKDCFRILNEFEKGLVSVEQTLDVIEEYDKLITLDRIDTRPILRKTLEDAPWRSCDCKICQKDGIQVIIFRGNNRNRRRGFHNTYVFYKILQQVLNGEEVPAGWGAKKSSFQDMPLFAINSNNA
jgi:hypothetical protein